jgi:hypothetical protein
VSGIELAAGVIGTFFGAGIAAGVLIVALPRVRRRRYGRDQDGEWRQPSVRDDERPPPWPGV